MKKKRRLKPEDEIRSVTARISDCGKLEN